MEQKVEITAKDEVLFNLTAAFLQAFELFEERDTNTNLWAYDVAHEAYNTAWMAMAITNYGALEDNGQRCVESAISASVLSALFHHSGEEIDGRSDLDHFKNEFPEEITRAIHELCVYIVAEDYDD